MKDYDHFIVLTLRDFTEEAPVSIGCYEWALATARQLAKDPKYLRVMILPKRGRRVRATLKQMKERL